MDWWRGARFRVYFDYHIPDFTDQVPPPSEAALTRIDPQRLVERAVAAGAEVIVFPARDNQGNAHYPTAIGHHLSDLHGRDLVDEFVAACRAHGARAVAYFQPIRNRRAFDDHPSWRQRNNDGTDRVIQPWLQEGEGGHKLVCPLGPAGDFALSELEELLTLYDLDGIWWDRVADVQGSDEQFACFCDSCASAHREQFGVDPPTSSAPGDPAWERFWHWRADRVLEFQTRARRVVNAGGAALIGNYAFFGMNLVNPAPLSVDVEAVAAATDVACLEYQHFQSLLTMSANPRLMAALTDQPCDLMSWNARFLGDGIVRSVPAAEAAVSTFIALGHAATFQDTVDHDGSHDERTFALVDHAFSRARRMEPFVTDSTLVRHSALLFSPRTYNAVDRGRYMTEFGGTFQQLLAMHVPLEVVSDRHLVDGGLSGVEVLVAPGDVKLDPRGTAVIEEFVRGGGVLVATGLSDLTALAGVTVSGEATGGRWLRALPGPLAAAGWAADHIPYRGVLALADAAASDVEVLAEVGNPRAGYDIFSHALNPAASWGPHAAVTLRPLGDGHVIYVAGAFGSASLQWGIPEHATPLAVARELAPPPIVKADAPASVELIARTAPGRVTVHLVNLQGHPGRIHHVAGLAPVLRGPGEVLPAVDISIDVAVPVRRAKEVLDGVELTVTPQGDGSRVVVPRLDVTGCVVLDL